MLPLIKTNPMIHYTSSLSCTSIVSVARIYSWNINNTRRYVDDLRSSDFWMSSDLMGNNSHSNR
jgi:hypothetical protein